MIRRLPSSPGHLGTRWGSDWYVTYRTCQGQQTWRWHFMLSYGFLVVYFIYNPLSRVTRTVIALMLGNAAANLQKLGRKWPRGYVWSELVVVTFVAPNMIVYQIRDATLRKPVLDLAVRLYATAIITVKRFMVKIADTFVVTAKYWIRINARRKVIRQSSWILKLLGLFTFHVQ